VNLTIIYEKSKASHVVIRWLCVCRIFRLKKYL